MKKGILLAAICLFALSQSAWAQKDETEDEIFETAQVAPEFPGGMSALFDYLRKNIKYPPKALKKGTEGTVVIRFMIDKDGSLSNMGIQKSLSKECDKEALRVVKKMPKWTPGYNGGKPVKCWFTLPIQFKLQ